MTGLNSEGARQAKQRLFSEPLIWQDSAEQRAVFDSLLAQQDLILIAGGRFLHVMPRADKAVAVSQLRQRVQQQAGYSLTLLACGDADNDLGMLELAELAVVFPGAAGGYLLPASQSVRHACRAGATGWLRGVSAALQSYSTATPLNPTP